MRLAPFRYLLYPRHYAGAPLVELQLTPGPDARPRLTPHPLAPVDLPYDIKQAIFSDYHDMRSSVEPDRVSSSRARTGSQGIPTDRGPVSMQHLLAKALKTSDGALRTEADARFAKQIGVGQPTATWAKLSPEVVAIKDQLAPETRLLLFDVRTQQLRQGVKIEGLPNMPACLPQDIQDEYLFNDDQDQLYLLLGRSGKVYAINAQLQARFVARLPEVVDRKADDCGVSRSAGPVRSAARLPTGQLAIATHTHLMVQQGDEFFELHAPPGSRQVIPSGPNELLVLARDGLARVRVPPSFFGPSRVWPDVNNAPVEAPPCELPKVIGCGSRSD